MSSFLFLFRFCLLSLSIGHLFRAISTIKRKDYHVKSDIKMKCVQNIKNELYYF